MSAASRILYVFGLRLPRTSRARGDQLGLGRAGLDQRGAHVPGRDLLAQRLAEDADAVLGRLVDAAAGTDASGRPPS